MPLPPEGSWGGPFDAAGMEGQCRAIDFTFSEAFPFDATNDPISACRNCQFISAYRHHQLGNVLRSPQVLPKQSESTGIGNHQRVLAQHPLGHIDLVAVCAAGLIGQPSADLVKQNNPLTTGVNGLHSERETGIEPATTSLGI